MRTKSFTNRLQKVLALVLTIAALAVGQQAQAESRTVTYKMQGEIYYPSGGNTGIHLTFVPSGTGFGYSTGPKTATITNIQNTSGFSVELDDGIHLYLRLASGSSMTFPNSSGYHGILLNNPSDQNASIRVASSHYCVTHVKLANLDGNALSGQASPWMTTIGSLDQDVDMVTSEDALGNYRNFESPITGSQTFAQLTVTYGDPREYAITYTNAVNGEAGVTNTNPTTYNVTTASFDVTAPTRTGYTLDGMTYTDAQHTNATTATLPMTISRGDAATRKAIAYTANWTPNTYTVQFNKNAPDATGTMSNQSFTYATAQNLTANAFTRTGYTFAGWNTAVDGTGDSYTNAQEVNNLTVEDNATVILYAQWTAHTYTVHFNANGGTNTMSDQPFTYATAQNLTANAFSRTGYTFAGWNTAADGSGDSYTDTQEVSNLTAEDNATVTLYAQWTPTTYNIIYDLAGGSVETNNPTTYNIETGTFTLVNPTRTGYTFDGWTGTGLSEPTMSVTIAQGSMGDKSYTANWTPNTYTVTLDNQSATSAGTTEITATFDAAMPAITVPAKTDYIFGGYYTETNGNGTKYYNADGTSANSWSIASATTLYALWIPQNVTYIDADGTEKSIAYTDFTILSDNTIPILSDDIGTIGTSGQDTWYVAIGNYSFNHRELDALGHVHLILCDGATFTVSGNNYGIDADNLTVYGQSEGTGRLVASTTANSGQVAICFINALTINGGNVSTSTVSGNGIYGNYSNSTLTINNGTVDAFANWDGIRCIGNITINNGTVDATAAWNGIHCIGNITINGGNVNAKGHQDGIYGRNIFINGGNVNATGGGCGINSEDELTLGWTNATDHITASSYYWRGVIVNRELCFDYDSGGINILGIGSQPLSFDLIDGKTLHPCLSLANNADNTAAINKFDGQHFDAVELDGRTLYKDGLWNTLCLPFNLTIAGSELDGDNVDVRALSSSDFDNGTLTLNFTDKGAVTELVAGTPYIIKWSKNDPSDPDLTNIVNPVFSNVTVSNASVPVTTDYVDFIGTYDPTVIYESGTDKHNLFLSNANTLYYPTTEGYQVNSFRAYFQLKNGLTAGESGTGGDVKGFVLNFDGSEDATSIDNGQLTIDNEAGAWYDLTGQMVNGKWSNGKLPKGIYIHNGKKEVVK